MIVEGTAVHGTGGGVTRRLGVNRLDSKIIASRTPLQPNAPDRTDPFLTEIHTPSETTKPIDLSDPPDLLRSSSNDISAQPFSTK